MIQVGIEVVDPNGIDTQALHQDRIAETDRRIAERVQAGIWVKARGTAWLVPVLSRISIIFGAQTKTFSYATPMIWKRVPSTLLTKSEPLTTRGETATV
jgi:hypothetical protein